MTLTVQLKRRVESRRDVNALTDAERAQFLAAMAGLIGQSDLPGVLRFCDKELMAWFHLLLTRDGAPAMEGWVNQVMDDAVFFDVGKTTPNGIVMSQTLVADETSQDRAALVAEVKAALRGFDSPPLNEWDRSG